jgi:hypothetical protein
VTNSQPQEWKSANYLNTTADVAGPLEEVSYATLDRETRRKTAVPDRQAQLGPMPSLLNLQSDSSWLSADSEEGEESEVLRFPDGALGLVGNLPSDSSWLSASDSYKALESKRMPGFALDSEYEMMGKSSNQTAQSGNVSYFPLIPPLPMTDEAPLFFSSNLTPAPRRQSLLDSLEDTYPRARSKSMGCTNSIPDPVRESGRVAQNGSSTPRSHRASHSSHQTSYKPQQQCLFMPPIVPDWQEVQPLYAPLSQPIQRGRRSSITTKSDPESFDMIVYSPTTSPRIFRDLKGEFGPVLEDEVDKLMRQWTTLDTSEFVQQGI